MDKLLNFNIFKNITMNQLIAKEINAMACKNDFLNREYRYMLLSSSLLNSFYSSRKFKYSNGVEGPASKKYIDKYIFNLCKNYITQVKRIIDELNAREYFEQKSIKWHIARQLLITATDSKKILSGKESEFLEVCKTKLLEIKGQPPSNSSALIHGNTYEDVSLKIYESRYNVKVSEYSVLGSLTHPYIGASPDGIITKVDTEDYNSFCRYGRLLEIKNPYSRIIDGTIKPEYYAQMQQQMFVTGLPLCDFLETDIKDNRCHDSFSCYEDQYENIHDMLNDKLDTTTTDWKTKVQNWNIPLQNLSKYGLEKGIILVFKKDIEIKIAGNNNDFTETMEKVELYPLDIPYEYETILAWIKQMKTKYYADGYLLDGIHNWRLYKFNVQTVHYDQPTYENVCIPKLKKAWDRILEYKKKFKTNRQEILDLFNKSDKGNKNNAKNVRRGVSLDTGLDKKRKKGKESKSITKLDTVLDNQVDKMSLEKSEKVTMTKASVYYKYEVNMDSTLFN